MSAGKGRGKGVERTIVIPIPTEDPLIATMLGFLSLWIANTVCPPPSRCSLAALAELCEGCVPALLVYLASLEKSPPERSALIRSPTLSSSVNRYSFISHSASGERRGGGEKGGKKIAGEKLKEKVKLP
jgi:hypothetical protein